MSTADDLRDLRDALDSIAHGALPRWGKPTTKTGEEAQVAARALYEKFVRALHHESAAKFGVAKARVETDGYRVHSEALTAQSEKLEAERDALREALRWYVKNDDTNDTEYNEPWLQGKRKAMKLLGMQVEEQD